MGLKKWIVALVAISLTLFVLQEVFDPTREIPDPYYRSLGHGQNVTSGSELMQILPLLNDTYQEDLFDCSEMAAFIEWYLEGHGVDTVIVTGKHDQPYNVSIGGFEYTNNSGDHAWVVANLSERRILVEPTLARIVPEALEQYYSPDGAYDDIYDMVGSSRSADEYDWWTVVEIDSPVPFPTPVKLPQASEMEKDLFDLVNRERAKRGLEPLKYNDEIADIARAHSHSPAHFGAENGAESGDLLRDCGVYYFDTSAEYMLSMPGPIYDYKEFLKMVSETWSSEESENQIPTSDFDETGIGAAVDSDGNIQLTRLAIRRIHCGYKGAPCCEEQGYYPWCYKPWKCNRGVCK